MRDGEWGCIVRAFAVLCDIVDEVRVDRGDDVANDAGAAFNEDKEEGKLKKEERSRCKNELSVFTSSNYNRL